MHSKTIHPRPTAARLLIASSVMAFVTMGTSAIVKQDPTMSGATSAAALAAVGTMICAAIGATVNPYPRWSYWTAAGFIAIALLVSPFTAPSPERWIHETRDMVWMAPWMLMMLWAVPTRSRGVCDSARSRSGYVLAGGALAVGVMIQLVGRL
jgi:hypothetical protein